MSTTIFIIAFIALALLGFFLGLIALACLVAVMGTKRHPAEASWAVEPPDLGKH